METEEGIRQKTHTIRKSRNKKPLVPTRERILEAFHELGTQTSVATFFGVSRKTIIRWIKALEIEPEVHPEVPIRQLMSSLLSDLTSRVRVAQWVIDEASITLAYSRRFDRTSLMLEGAMNDDGAVKVIAEELQTTVISGAHPPNSRLPTHIVKIQGPKAYAILDLVSREMTGLKSLEATAAQFLSSHRISQE